MKKKKNKMKINKKVNYILGGISLFILISIGVYYFINNNKSSNNNVEEEPEVVEKEKKLEIVDLDSKIRPYAIMINNIGVARPLQSGLQDAYIMYEMIVEGGLTRYLALFMDKDVDRIGSIRSARHYYLDYALENDAFYVHHGQSPQAQAQFSSLGIDRIVVDNSKTGWRDKKLRVASEHTLFTSTKKLESGIGNKRTERKKDLLLNYSIEEINLDKYNDAKLANNVEIEYSNHVKSSYVYDLNLKTYKRFVNGKEHIDYVTEKQYTFKNIITYQVRNYSISGDSSGRQELNNVGEGSGYYVTNGYAVPIIWSKSSRSSQTVYKYQNGEEIIVNDGNTFIQIQPSNKSLIIN
ncbi:MAG: DUF3048 domain-containing protein [Bacilli bacterium]|nr:DUF3048 domain-containing protein [Bacilli bacterium]MDD4406910.1 DUF3048 domain-containing protein [Bacilli bacterium]